MTKKGYQRRLPTVLPTVPSPRASPEQVKLAQPVQPAAPVTRPEPVSAAGPVVTRPAPERSYAPPGARESKPVPAPVRRRVSPWTAVGIGAAILVALVVGGILVASVVGGPEDPAAESGSASAAPAAAPRVLAGDEAYVESRVLADGDVVVRQWIRADEPLQRLRLRLPEVPGVALSASEVEVVADGALVAGPATVTGLVATYTFEETTNVQVSYRLSGAVERSDSAAGRALAVATTLDVRYVPRPARETRIVRATEVLALACSPSPEVLPEPCGQADETGQWRVDLAGPRVVDRVVAQLTLD